MAAEQLRIITKSISYFLINMNYYTCFIIRRGDADTINSHHMATQKQHYSKKKAFHELPITIQ